MEHLAAIYARISSDREGEALGVQRQEEDCRDLADRLGVEIVRVYCDNDRSASTRTKTARPDYTAMLQAARDGEFGVILAYSNSRLTRRPRELEDLIELHERHGVQIHTVVSGSDDLATADGRMVARIKANVDAAEAERTAERVARAARQAAEAGKWHGGRRPYGFEPDGVTVRETEAEAIRDAYRLILAGGSLRSVAEDFNSRGLVTSTGHRWTAKGVREMVVNPRYAGRRVYRGEVIGDAVWEAIVDPITFDAVHALIRDPGRRRPHKWAPRRLLSGLALCGVCGATMHCSGANGDQHRYRCSVSLGHVSRSGPRADGYVQSLVIARLSQPDAVDLICQPNDAAQDLDDARQQLEAARTRLDQLAVAFADGDLTASQLRAATQRLNERISDLEERVAVRSRDDVLGQLVTAEDVAAVWETLDTDRRRSIIGELMTIRILPTMKGSRTFRPESISIEWNARSPSDGDRS